MSANRFNIHAILPRLSSELGHIYHYHLSVQKSLNQLGWNYYTYVPKGTKIKELPPNWFRCLANDIAYEPKNIWDQFKFLLINALAFRAIFRKISDDTSSILFIEHFEFQHLASIVLALFGLKPKFQFWILHRYELNGRKLKIILHRLFLHFMSKKLGKTRVKCFTDSELLMHSLRSDLQFELTTVPIPHTEACALSKRSQNTPFRFWWPGGLVRHDKGIQVLRNLVTKINRSDIQIIAAENAKKVIGTHSCIEFIPNYLSRMEYINQMNHSDLILLPYCEKEYAFRTSGIFVEAISVGAIPVTTKGTWMAYELGKFNLTELIFNWDEDDIINHLLHVLSNKEVESKLRLMQTHYQIFHCESGFATALKKITHF